MTWHLISGIFHGLQNLLFFFLQIAIEGFHFHPLQLLLKLSVVAKVTQIVIQQTRTEHTWLFQMCNIHMVAASWME